MIFGNSKQWLKSLLPFVITLSSFLIWYPMHYINEPVTFNFSTVGTGTDTHASEQLSIDDKSSSPESIAVFYNVYSKSEEHIGTSVNPIIKEQLSQLLPQHEVFVRSIGAPLEIQMENVTATLIQHNESGSEFETLQLLWQHCHDRQNSTTDAKVVYLHSKGSFHPSERNDRLRRFITRGALSQECANLPATCNVCSSRMSPFPHPHTSGNMWLARCSYVRKLIEPIMFGEKMAQFDSNLKDHCIGKNRFAAEHWIHSHPTVMPCDLYKDTSFVAGYPTFPIDQFEIDLKPAPRPNLEYNQRGHCKDSGLSIKNRHDEYLKLYGEYPPKEWWGWAFFNMSYDSFQEMKQNRK